jgi:hypothetical protein
VGHDASVTLAEVVVTWEVSLALVGRTGADAVAVVVWTRLFVFVVETDVLVVMLVVTLVAIVVDCVGLSVVVTTTRAEKDEWVCVKVVTTVMADGIPGQSKISNNKECQGR